MGGAAAAAAAAGSQQRLTWDMVMDAGGTKKFKGQREFLASLFSSPP
jgi:hypothetical protein